MRWVWVLLALGELTAVQARTLPIRRYESKVIPLAITQDRAGYLWLATPDGIVRFDGQHYESIHPPPGIDISGIRDIYVSPGGSIWMATPQGLVRYNHGTFSRELAGIAVKSLIVTSAGRLLVGVESDLYLAAEPDRKIVRWTFIDRLTVNGRFQPGSDGRIWFGCGLYLCKWTDDQIRQVAAGAKWSSFRTQPLIKEDIGTGTQLDFVDIVGLADGHIWARSGPNVLDMSGGQSVRHTLPVGTFHGLRPGFFLDHTGRLWIPGQKLNVVENGKLRPFETPGALFEDVTTIFEDRNGTLWFGLAGKGLVALPSEEVLQTWSGLEGITGSVLDLALLPHFGLTAATNSGVFSFDPARDVWKGLPAPGAVRVVSESSHGELLMVPYTGGLLHNGHEVSLPNGFNYRRMRYLLRDRRGDVWVGSVDGLYRLNTALRFTQVPLPNNDKYVSDLTEAPDGRIWAGYEGGVAVCEAEGCKPVISQDEGLLDPRIRTIAPRDDEIWVGYRPSGAFSRFIRQPGGAWKAIAYSPENGYGPPDTHFLRRDSRGWIWRGSTDGVYVCDGVHTDPDDWLHLTFGDGVNESYANMYAWMEQADGSVWIGTQKGVVRLQPSRDWFQPVIPRVGTMPATLRANQDLEVRTSQPGLPPFLSRQLRYRLLPTDRAWRFSSTGVLHFSKLAPGPYRLQVASGTGRQPVEYSLRVEGAPWLPWSLGIGTVVGGAIWGLFGWRRLRRKTRQADEYWRQKREFLELRAESEPATEPAEDWSGRVLDGRFLLERRLAAGGFASVYRGLDQSSGEAVAIKLLHPLRDHERWRRRRFVDEVVAMQKLHDPGIVEVRHAGEAAPDRPYLAMTFIEGITLRDLLRDEGGLDFDRAARLLEQIGHALATAHRANVLHRDLKPENIMVREAGRPTERILLIDFGIASLVEEQAGEPTTTRIAGSPGYLAPERWVGLASCRSDIYSLGVIAAEILSGAVVAELGNCAGDPAGFRDRMLARRPELPRAALDLLASALAYDPDARPSDAEIFTRNLSQTLHDASTTV